MAFRISLGVVLATLLSTPAFAYRPFESTDADVADERELELEIGFGYSTADEIKSLLLPIAANYGIGANREIVLEGIVSRMLEPQDDEGTSIDDAAILLKQIHRPGSLQGEAGISIASECGALLPSASGEDRLGATFALIASRRWQAVTFHANAKVELERDHRWQQSLGAILEGPDAWAVRPVSEITFGWQEDESPALSALVGLIWSAKEMLSFDLGVRHREGDSPDAWEIRVGLTWTH